MSTFDRPLSRRKLSAIGVGLAAGTALTTITHPAFAQDATPEGSPADDQGGMPPLPEGAIPVAQGLWNPNGLAIAEDGTLYIAEAGVAGGGEAAPAVAATPLPDGSLPVGPLPLVAPQVSKVAPDGTQSIVTTEAGGTGIAIVGTEAYVVNGGTSVSTGFAQIPGENTIRAIDLATGAVRQVAELGTYEIDNNPDGLDINPNLYGIAASPDGILYVADAGGNTIYTVDPASGSSSLFAVVPTLTDLTGATPTAEEEAMQPGPRQPVPTGIVVDDASTITVGLLGENWSGPSILNYAPDGTYTEGVSGIPFNVAIALGPDGLLYASQLTADFSGEMPAPGNVFRIAADGTVEPVVQGLFFPHGIAFDADGNLYVTANSIISAPDAPAGMVLKFEGIATSM
ncbi:MAG: ScyD/ScyE family protein [Thermomicrobiales bacterium]